MTEEQGSQNQLAQRCADLMYANDRASQALGIEIEEVAAGYSKLSMPVREDMLNGHENCHGGFMFALADSAFAFACNSYNQVTVAQGCSIEFIRPASLGDRLVATAIEQSRGKTTGIYDIVIVRDDGKKVAVFRGKSFALNQKFLGSDSKSEPVSGLGSKSVS